MGTKSVCRVGDISLGACGKPAIPAVSSLAKMVLVNGRPPIVAASYWGTHCDDGCHIELGMPGNPTVLINGLAVVTTGTVLSNGDIAGAGSVNVLA